MTRIGVFLVVALFLPLVHTDVYMHNPKGSNNRLNEENRERNNANRVFDSQNNNRGGYNKGGLRDDDLPMQFIAGSEIPIEWTSQHECGQENTRCDIILQYMCDPNLRDGTSTGKINDDDLEDGEQNKGRHESPEYYANCEGRQRNQGLFVADQDLNGDTAKYTRQNPNGARSGLECPEERDYYPYWAPSPWRDIAVLTDDTSRCAEIRRESQNVKAKPYCAFKTKDALRRGKDNPAPLTEDECNDMPSDKYEWISAPAHNIEAPKCLPAPKARDNHNGNGVSDGKDGTSERIPQTLRYMWKVPNTPSAGCTLRIRYNISVLDYNPKTTFSGANIDIKGQYGINGNDRGYVFENNPIIKPLKVNGNIENDFELELAINTAQTGRVFQDRAHKFVIRVRDPSIPADARIHNWNIRGRRGNIVQVYPAVEYDFVPNVLEAKRGDYVHPQWTGALTLPKNDDGEGKAGTDKNNIVLLTPKPFGGSENTNKFADGYPTTNYLQPINSNTVMGLSTDIAEKMAVPREGDKPATYYLNPCPSTKKDELLDELDSELGTLSLLLDETLNKLHNVEKHDRTRRSTTDDELVDQEIDYEKESTKDDEDEDVGEEGEDSNDPQRRRSRRNRRSRSRSTSSSASSSPGTLIPLTRNYACEAYQKRQEQQQQTEDTRRRSRSRSRRRRRDYNTQLDDAPAYVDIGPQKAEVTGNWRCMCTRNNNFSNRSQKCTVIVS